MSCLFVIREINNRRIALSFTNKILGKKEKNWSDNKDKNIKVSYLGYCLTVNIIDGY